MEINYADIGARIRKYRLAAGWTQESLAERAGVEPSNLSHIERGATKLSLPTLISLCNALGVTADEVLCGSLIKSGHIAVREIDALLADCSDRELHALAEMLRTTKQILQKK